MPARLAPLGLRRLLPCWREPGFPESLPVRQQIFETLHESLPPRIVECAETAEIFGQSPPVPQILQVCVAVPGPIIGEGVRRLHPLMRESRRFALVFPAVEQLQI